MYISKTVFAVLRTLNSMSLL